MTWITVDADLDNILPEFDNSDIIQYVYYNMDVEEVLNQYDYDDIRKFLFKEVGDIVIEDTDTLKDLLDPTCDPYLLKDFIQEIYKLQRGE
jgi:hypothetical protein